VRGYEPLIELLDSDIPVFGVQSRMLHGQEEHDSLPAMTADYSNEVNAFFPEGPFGLFGYSMGGYLAASVAQRLEAAGRVAEFIGVADCPDWAASSTQDTSNRLAKLIASSYQEAVGGLPFLKPLDDSDWSSFLPITRELTQHPEEGPALLLEWLTSSGSLDGKIPQQTIAAHLQRVARHLVLLGAPTAMPVVEGSLFIWQASRGLGAGTDSWRRKHDLPVVNRLIEADHASIMNPPAVTEIARQINLAYESRLV
jgi:thioesterase domain-containing protein